MAAVRFIVAVFAHEVIVVRRRRRGDRDQAAEVHQQAAVAVEHDHLVVGHGERDAERVRGALAMAPTE